MKIGDSMIKSCITIHENCKKMINSTLYSSISDHVSQPSPCDRSIYNPKIDTSAAHANQHPHQPSPNRVSGESGRVEIIVHSYTRKPSNM